MNCSKARQLNASTFSESFSKKDKNINQDFISKLAHNLLRLIAYRSKKTGYCYEKVKTFSEEFQYSVSSVQRALNELVERKLIYRVRDGNRWVSMLPDAYEHRDELFALNRPRDISKVYYSIKPYTAPDLEKILCSKMVVGPPVYFGQFDPPVDRCDDLCFDACLPIHTKDIEPKKHEERVVKSAASRQPATTPFFKNKNTHKHSQPIVPRKVITDQELECLYRCYPNHRDEVDKRLKNARKVLSMIENSGHTSTSPIYKLGEYGLAKKYLDEWKARTDEKKAKQRENTMTDVYLEKSPESDRLDLARKLLQDRPWLDRYLKIEFDAVILILPNLRPLLATLPTYSISKYDLRFKDRLEDLAKRIEDFHFDRAPGCPDVRAMDIWKSLKEMQSQKEVQGSYKK